VIGDLRAVGTRSLTIGQYLQATPRNLPVERYYHPDEFKELADFAYSIGFDHVASGPLVRSSYKAEEAAKIYYTVGAKLNFAQSRGEVELRPY